MRKAFVDLLPDKLIRTFAAPYLAGEGEAAVLATAQELLQKRRIVSTFDLLGEEIKSFDEAKYVCEVYCHLMEQLPSLALNGPSVSIKPTSLGIDLGKDVFCRFLLTILEKGKSCGVPVTIDMEGSAYTDVTLAIYHEMLPYDVSLGVVIQSRLKRSLEDVRALNVLKEKMGITARVRLCIGIYSESPSISLQDKKEMKKQLLELAQELSAGGHYVEIASHDEHVVAEACELVEKKLLDPSRLEFQMLYGVNRVEVQDSLIKSNYKVRLYLPFTTHWRSAIAYLRRRMVENPHLVWYTLKNLF